MRKTLIAVIAAAPLVALGAAAFAAQPTTASKNDDLFVKASSTASAAEKAEPLKGVNIKSIARGDDGQEHGLKGEHGEMGEGMDD